MNVRKAKFAFGSFFVLIVGMATFGSCTRVERASMAAPATTGKSRVEISKAQSDSAKVDFDADIRPIFAANCQPCHFPGGKVYAQLPFDQPETIRQLGARLFSRIKDERERQLIRAFLDMSTNSSNARAKS